MTRVQAIKCIKEDLACMNPDAVTMDGFDDALIGTGETFGKDTVAVYDRDKCIKVLMKDGMTQDDAAEHLDFNCLGTGINHAPIFLTRY